MKRFKRVHVEISNICNLQCGFCPAVHREKKVMGEELFSRIIPQLAPLTGEVCLHLMGEPLGHPRFARMVEICAEHGVPVNLTTNGTLLTEEKGTVLLSPIVRQVNFSVQSFEANFGDQDPTTYLKRLFAFVERALVERPDLYVNFRIWDLQDPVSLSPLNERIRNLIEAQYGFRLDPASVDLRRRKGFVIRGRVYLSLDSRFEWPSMGAPLRSEVGFCHGLSNHFGIHADGTVVPCCLDKEADLALGNCATRPITEILDGDRALRITEGFKRGQCTEALCQRCDFIKRFDGRARVLAQRKSVSV